MGMSGASANNGGRRRRRRGRNKAILSEINVTPLVDVMLVLLIVFMVAAPLMTVGVPIDLPKTQANTLNTESKPITISVTNDALIYIGEQQIELVDLVANLQKITASNAQENATDATKARIYVRGDASADYGNIMQVMGVLSKAGYTKIGLITEQEQGR